MLYLQFFRADFFLENDSWHWTSRLTLFQERFDGLRRSFISTEKKNNFFIYLLCSKTVQKVYAIPLKMYHSPLSKLINIQIRYSRVELCGWWAFKKLVVLKTRVELKWVSTTYSSQVVFIDEYGWKSRVGGSSDFSPNPCGGRGTMLSGQNCQRLPYSGYVCMLFNKLFFLICLGRGLCYTS
jgi:hypothetical protein